MLDFRTILRFLTIARQRDGVLKMRMKGSFVAEPPLLHPSCSGSWLCSCGLRPRAASGPGSPSRLFWKRPWGGNRNEVSWTATQTWALGARGHPETRSPVESLSHPLQEEGKEPLLSKPLLVPCSAVAAPGFVHWDPSGKE